jgi:ABC-type nitrate/sulfonate/bicarbonate transport system substrate-binding protein
MGTGDLAQTEDLEIGIVVSSLLYAPIWLAERRGFLAEEGFALNSEASERPTALRPRFTMESCLSPWDLRKVLFLTP